MATKTLKNYLFLIRHLIHIGKEMILEETNINEEPYAFELGI